MWTTSNRIGVWLLSSTADHRNIMLLCVPFNVTFQRLRFPAWQAPLASQNTTSIGARHGRSAESGRCYRYASQGEAGKKTREWRVFELRERSRSVHYLHLDFIQPSDNHLRWVFFPNANRVICPSPKFTLWFEFPLLFTTRKHKVAYLDRLRVDWSFGWGVWSICMQWTTQACSHAEFFFRLHSETLSQ